jgi:hypothetical protein
MQGNDAFIKKVARELNGFPPSASSTLHSHYLSSMHLPRTSTVPYTFLYTFLRLTPPSGPPRRAAFQETVASPSEPTLNEAC